MYYETVLLDKTSCFIIFMTRAIKVAAMANESYQSTPFKLHQVSTTFHLHTTDCLRNSHILEVKPTLHGKRKFDAPNNHTQVMAN